MVERRAIAARLKSDHEMSERRACSLLRLSRCVYRYKAKRADDAPVREALSQLAEKHPEMGFGKYFTMLRRSGKRWNHKRVHRIYCQMKLNKRRKHKRRLPVRNPQPLAVPEAVNKCWSVDFMSDALWNGRRFRTFNVVDDFNREAVAIEIDTSLTSERVVRTLDQAAEWRGLPLRVRLDNGPELTSVAVADWAEMHGIELEFIKPGRPMQNGFVERFNRTYREAVLDMFIFETLDDVKRETERFLDIYNNHRPHDSLGGRPPSESRGHLNLAENCNQNWR